MVALYATQTAGEDDRTKRVSQVGRGDGDGVSSELDEDGETQELIASMIVPVDLLSTGHTRQTARAHIFAQACTHTRTRLPSILR